MIGLSFVGAAGFEPATPCSQNRCANRTALRPDIHLAIELYFFSRAISCPDIYPLIDLFLILFETKAANSDSHAFQRDTLSGPNKLRKNMR